MSDTVPTSDNPTVGETRRLATFVTLSIDMENHSIRNLTLICDQYS